MSTDATAIIGIDPATHCGFCWTNGTERVYGTWDLSRFNRHPGEKLAMLRQNVMTLAHTKGCDLLAFEDAGFGAGPGQMTTMAFHNQMRGLLLLCAFEMGVRVVVLKPTTIKAFATGNGHAKKPQMIRACETHYGIRGIDDNAADAIFIAELAQRPDCWPEKTARKASGIRGRRKSAATLFT